MCQTYAGTERSECVRAEIDKKQNNPEDEICAKSAQQQVRECVCVREKMENKTKKQDACTNNNTTTAAAQFDKILLPAQLCMCL